MMKRCEWDSHDIIFIIQRRQRLQRVSGAASAVHFRTLLLHTLSPTPPTDAHGTPTEPPPLLTFTPSHDHAVDIADLISLEVVQRELGLGPNGGLLYCIDYLEKNIDWLREQLIPLEEGVCV
jgi:hypothetical protein